MMRRTARVVILVAVSCLAALGAAGVASACDPIPRVPETITRPGAYCVTRPLSTPIASGAAITIASSDVTLDLAGFTIANTAGPSTAADGIVAEGQNITIVNGTVRGFRRGVTVNFATGPAGGGGNRVERVRALESRSHGILVSGDGSVVRQNQVIETHGGSGAGLGAAGGGVHVVDNDVFDVVAAPPATAVGLGVVGNSAVIEGNRVGNPAVTASPAIGIAVDESLNVMTVGNRLSNLDAGIIYAGVPPPGTTGICVGNLFSGVTTPQIGC
jgi:hypothetical protein